MDRLDTSALVLRALPYSETSQVVRLLAPEGVHNALAKGIKRPKSTMGGPLDNFVVADIELSLRRGHDALHILTKCRHVEWFQKLHESLPAWHAAELVREVLLSTPTPDADAISTLDLTLKALRALNSGQPPVPVAVRFLASLLRLHGLTPDLFACVKTGRVASGTTAVTLSLRESGLLSPAAAKGAPETVTLSPKLLALLRVAFEPQKNSAEFSHELWLRALEIVAKLTEHALGHYLQTPAALLAEVRRVDRTSRKQ